ncbi:hypothetical protein MAP00_007821 [Monascus purpureus]|nr:hypothetical protein MAP00_007821 [Monascus purpureus]
MTGIMSPQAWKITFYCVGSPHSSAASCRDPHSLDIIPSAWPPAVIGSPPVHSTRRPTGSRTLIRNGQPVPFLAVLSMRRCRDRDRIGPSSSHPVLLAALTWTAWTMIIARETRDMGWRDSGLLIPGTLLFAISACELAYYEDSYRRVVLSTVCLRDSSG